MSGLLNSLMNMKNINDSNFPKEPIDSDEEDELEEKTLQRIKQCDCSYDPFNENYTQNSEKCSVKLALRNHITYPSFQMMTEHYDPSMIFYQENHYGLEPRIHWATLIEISHDLSFVRPGCCGRNQFGEKISVHFYHENDEKPISFKWSQLKPGYTN